MSKDDWHYARHEFCRTVFTLLVEGPAHAVRLFGPRRTGKTQFLLRDLGKLAEERGHRVVYASLWQQLGSPIGILLYEMDRTLRGGGIVDRLKTAAGSISAKFEIKVPGDGKLAIDLGRREPPEASHLIALDKFCARLANRKKPTFLLLDEIQELAKSAGAHELIAALRTSLDKRKDCLVTVFTGSSQEGLRAMFSDREAPFYRFAELIDLPNLGTDFVDHQLKAFRTVSRRKVTKKEAMTAFERCEKNPMFFQKWLMKLALNPSIPLGDAFAFLRDEIAEEFGFTKLWLKLRPIQRAAARLIAESIPQVYGDTGLQRIKALTREKPPTSSQLQTAIKRLSRLDVIDKTGGNWRIGDPLLAAWIRARPESEF